MEESIWVGMNSFKKWGVGEDLFQTIYPSKIARVFRDDSPFHDCRTVWCPVCTRNFPVVWCGRGLGIGLDSSSFIAGYRLCNYDCQVIKGYINHKPWDNFMCIIWYDPIQYTIPMHIGTPFITMIIVICPNPIQWYLVSCLICLSMYMDLSQSNT